jgi:hypothetical protein
MSYIYTFIRRDLSPEQKIVQLGHACHEAGKILKYEENQEVSSLILLPAENERELKSIARKIDCAGIDFHMFFEPDNDMGYSAICTRPIITERERRFFSRWDLYRAD